MCSEAVYACSGVEWHHCYLNYTQITFMVTVVVKLFLDLAFCSDNSLVVSFMLFLFVVMMFVCYLLFLSCIVFGTSLTV